MFHNLYTKNTTKPNLKDAVTAENSFFATLIKYLLQICNCLIIPPFKYCLNWSAHSQKTLKSCYADKTVENRAFLCVFLP